LIDGNIFRNNSCDTQIGAGVVSFWGTSSPQIINNLFIDNLCRAITMIIPMGPTPLVYNNTIVGNPVGILVDARVPAVAQIYRNNLLVGNTVGLAVEFSVAAAYNPTWEYNLVFGNTSNYEGIPDQTGLQHNISADPLFVDPAHGVYALQTTSPAIDRGTDVQCPTHDLSNAVRPQGQSCDIGAYELIRTKTYIPLIQKP
jgi:serine protease